LFRQGIGRNFDAGAQHAQTLIVFCFIDDSGGTCAGWPTTGLPRFQHRWREVAAVGGVSKLEFA
jgi:hypothetical protein